MKKIILIIATVNSLFANEADILNVVANCDTHRDCNFNVTIKHNDTGWKHYVNKYEIVSESGAILGTRVLFHPHVNEQPFTRSLYDLKIPKSIKSVTVRAYDSVHQYGGKEFTLKLF